MVTCKTKRNFCKNVLEPSTSFPRICRGRKNVIKMFYFTCYHLLSSTCLQHAETFAKMFYCFILHVTTSKTFLQMFCRCFISRVTTVLFVNHFTSLMNECSCYWYLLLLPPPKEWGYVLGLPVCLSAILIKNCERILMKFFGRWGWVWPKDQVILFRWQSRSRSGSGDFLKWYIYNILY